MSAARDRRRTWDTLSELQAGGGGQQEHKYLLDADAASWIWKMASSRLRVQQDKSSRFFVRTTYYDTHDFSYYRSSRGPIARRLRVREYSPTGADGKPEGFGSCFLELKQSAGGMRGKSRVALPASEVPEHLSRLVDAPFRACVATCYRRAALTDEGERLRITFDEGLAFCEPLPLGAPATQPHRLIETGPSHILEVKLWDAPPAWLAFALNGLSEAVGFSKFMAGMKAAERKGLITPDAAKPAA